MSAAGNPYDNANPESFFKTLKIEWLESRRFATREQASRAVGEYLLYYNRVRLYSSLDYLSPAEYEQGANHRPIAS